MPDPRRPKDYPDDLSFAARLNQLFEAVHPPGRGPYRDAEVADGMTRLGYPISRPYLCQLRSGQRTHPSEMTIQAFAEFFRVDIEYFTDDKYYLRIQDELNSLTQPRDGLVASLARRLTGLSLEAQDEINRAIDRAEHRPAHKKH